MDSGFRKTHEAIPIANMLDQFDFVDNDTNPEVGNADEDKHGTATASNAFGMKDGQIYGTAFDANFLLARLVHLSLTL